MNPILFRQLRNIEPDIARSYERVCRTVGESIERHREQQELIDDVDALVDQLLGKIDDLESEAREAKEELYELKNAELESNTKPHSQSVDVEKKELVEQVNVLTQKYQEAENIIAELVTRVGKLEDAK